MLRVRRSTGPNDVLLRTCSARPVTVGRFFFERMPPPQPLSSLDHAQADYDAGRYIDALEAARAADAASPADGAALRLRCLAAFRLGEVDEAAQAALQLVALTARSEQAQPLRFDVLTVSVVAAGELARFDQSIEHLKLVQQAASRAGTHHDFMRGRGTMATCFALLGDPWAGQRLLAELIGQFQASAGTTADRRLEATVRVNHASVCLQIARLARQGGEAADCVEALEHAQASIERTREIARELQEARIGAFADVHEAELALLRSEHDSALRLLHGAVAQADGAGLWAHARQLRLLEAEALHARSDDEGAWERLHTVGLHLGEGHEIGARIRWHSQLQHVLRARGEPTQALEHLEHARTLAQYRQYRQARAQSRFLRARLELEHLYRFRPGT
jgi:tetratricopeptide (TPR) repeat protein